MVVLPPGTLLQLMYLEERLRGQVAGRFIEIGPGSGEITALLLRLGWTGLAYDLEPKTIDGLSRRFEREIAEGRLRVVNADFVSADQGVPEAADMVISCMVMEHMEDAQQLRFMHRAAQCLAPEGCMIGLVPASPGHWGIEDDIAGHCRRYTRSTLQALAAMTQWRISHQAGLTFPVSNVLLPLSNLLVRRAEQSRLGMTAEARTRLSGRRNVLFKTRFPSIVGILINRITLSPLHWLQKFFSASPRALVLYFEARPDRTGSSGRASEIA